MNMGKRLVGGGLVFVALLAGCIGDSDLNDEPTTVEEETNDSPAPLYTAEWEDHWVVSGAYEAPAHFVDTFPVGNALWPSAMFDIDTEGTPDSIVARFDWSGTGEVQLMVAIMIDQDRMIEYTVPGPDEFTSSAPLCLEVPEDGLKEGTWQFMPHTLYGADISFTMNVTIDGTASEPYQGVSNWPTTAEYVQMAADGRIENTAAPC